MQTYAIRRVKTWRSNPRLFLLGDIDYMTLYSDFGHPEHGLLHSQIHAFYANYKDKPPTSGYLKGLRSIYEKIAAQSNLIEISAWQELSADMQNKLAEFESRVSAAIAAPPEPEPEPIVVDPYKDVKEAVRINMDQIKMYLAREATENNLRLAMDSYYRIEKFTKEYMQLEERSRFLKSILTSIQIFRANVYPEYKLPESPGLFESIAKALKPKVWTYPVWVDTELKKAIYQKYKTETIGRTFPSMIDPQTGGPHPGAPGPKGYYDGDLFMPWEVVETLPAETVIPIVAPAPPVTIAPTPTYAIPTPTPVTALKPIVTATAAVPEEEMVTIGTWKVSKKNLGIGIIVSLVLVAAFTAPKPRKPVKRGKKK